MHDFRTSIFTTALIIITLLGCEDSKTQDPNEKSKIVSLIDGGQVAPGSSPVANPRDPNLKTYDSISGGFFSVQSGTTFSLTSSQTFFGASANRDALVVAIKRTDVSGLIWIDIFQISKGSTSLTFICKIRNDGNFSAGLRFDNQKLYFKNSASTVIFRKFRFSDCLEETALVLPPANDQWIQCSNWDIYMDSPSLCYYSRADNTIQTIKTYYLSSGLLSTVVTAPSWYDFVVAFSIGSPISETASGIWGIQSASKNGYTVTDANLFYIDKRGTINNWATLPTYDYPDLGYSANLFTSTEDDKNLYIISSKADSFRYYLLDVESF